jgi:SAM-dependent methyltransferase
VAARSKTVSRSATDPARRDWNRAYALFPRYAADFAWAHVTEVLRAYPGRFVYEVGFGSGLNLRWAREHGWIVAGCDVAEPAVARARAELPGADLRNESILDCSAPSDRYDVVIDRAALTYLSRGDMKKALAHVRRILKPGGVFLFNPYGMNHTWPFPDGMPPVTRWDLASVRRLFPETKWELLEVKELTARDESVAESPCEHTIQAIARKIA